MKFFASLLFFIYPLSLFANINTETHYTEDRYFVTTGDIDFDISPRDVGATLLEYNNYSLWALKGMQGVDKESEGLLCYFTAIDYAASSNLFLVTFDINIIWPFGRKGSVLEFRPEQSFREDGMLESITLTPLLGPRFVEDAQVVFYLRETDSGSSIYFESRIKLTKFLDFFFSLRAYKKNFEWYVVKVAENLSDYLNFLY